MTAIPRVGMLLIAFDSGTDPKLNLHGAKPNEV